MISFLRVLHEHAAKRGDGLRTEFLTHLSCRPNGRLATLREQVDALPYERSKPNRVNLSVHKKKSVG